MSEETKFNENEPKKVVHMYPLVRVRCYHYNLTNFKNFSTIFSNICQCLESDQRI